MTFLLNLCLPVPALTYPLLNRYCYLVPVRSLYTIFVYSRDANFVRTNPRTASFRRQRSIIPRIAKYHSVEMGDTLRGSSTAIPRIAAQKLCGIRTEFPRISSAFVKFLVTSTIIAPTCGTCLLCTMATAQASSHQCCFYTDVKLGHCTFPQS